MQIIFNNIKVTLVAAFMLFGLLFQSQEVKSQCFQVYDGFGVLQNTPYWIGCSGNDFTIFIQTDIALGNYTIVWGDGTANSNGASLIPPAFVQHTYTATVDTFDISITDNSNGCVTNGVVVMEEPVNASIQIPVGGVTVVCAPSPIDFLNSSTNVSSTTTFTWDFGDGTPPIVFGPGNAGQTVPHTYERNTVSCETVVTLTAENYCSFGNPTTALFAPLMVYDIDTAAINASATLLCYPDTVVNFDNATLKNCLPEGNVQQRFEYWNLGDYWGLGYDSIISWVPFDPPAQPGHTIAFPGIGSYTIMMIDSNTCGRDTAFQTITIIGPPTASFTTSIDSACVNEVVNMTNTSSASANNFLWDFDDGNGFVSAGANPSKSYNNSGTKTIILVVGIGGTSGSCTDTAQKDVYIKPSPVADFVLDSTYSCDSLAVNIGDSTSGAVAWSWTFGNGNTSTSSTPTTQYYNSPGAYRIRLVVTHVNGCTDSDSEWVNVYPSPTASFVANSVCQNEVASFTDLSNSPGSDPITSWSWGFGDGNTDNQQNTTNIYTNIGDYEVTLLVATANCSDSIADSVTVQVTPNAAFTISDTAGCSPFAVNTTNMSAGATIYAWDFGDGFGSSTFEPSITYLNNDTIDTTYTLTLISSTSFGCKDTANTTVTVFGGPNANFTHNSIPDCGPITVGFTNTTSGGVSYLWDFGDTSNTSNLENPSHIFHNTTQFITNYIVTLVATNADGCTDTATQIVKVYPEPIFPFSTIPDSGCSPLSVSFPAIIGAVSYFWDFGDGSTATGQTPTHVFYNTTTNDQLFNVRLIAISPFGCADTTTEIVTVYPEPTAIFTTPDSTGCGPMDVVFTNGSLNATNYVWDFGDGDTSQSSGGIITHTFNNILPIQAIYTTSLIAITPRGCADTATRDITIHPAVYARFTADSSGCTPLTINYSNTTIGGNSYIWDFGDGGASGLDSPSHTFYSGLVSDTSYQISMIATSIFGCADTITDSVTVFHRATASISKSVNSGCSPLDVMLTNSSYGYDNLYLDYGDGSFTITDFATINHTYINTITVPDTFDIQLLTNTINGCADTAFTSLIVYPKVYASFNADTTGCSQFSVDFTNTSSGSTAYQWNFGNGSLSNAQNPTEVFSALTTTQTFTTTLISASIFGCTDTTSKTITVHPSAVASFTSNKLLGCSPLAVTFSNSSIDYDNLFWDFGDGSFSSSTAATLNHGYNNTSAVSVTYNINLIASNIQGCNDTATMQIEVYPNITADATFDTVGCSPFFVQFNNLSQGANTYLWDLGNGVISSNQSPNKTYVNPGSTPLVIPIKLTSTSSFGCSDEYNSSITVYPQPVANFIATPPIQAFPNTIVTISNNTTGTWTHNWDFGNGSTFVGQNPAPIDFVNIGDYTIQLVISNPYCADTATQLVSILPPPPEAGFTGGGSGCAPITVVFQNTSKYGTSYFWDFGDGNTSVQENPIYTYFYPGVYDVSLKVTGKSGEDTMTKIKYVEVYSVAIANFDYQPLVVSTTGDKTFFYNQSANATIFDWNFGDGGTSTDKDPIYQYAAVGNFPITLISNNVNNCPDTITHSTQITVEAKGEVKFPNAFVPVKGGGNGGVYDPNNPNSGIFHPVFKGVDGYHLVIYNRWGELVFETFDINIGWDGYYRHEMSAQDAYVWKADVTFVNGEQKIYSGDVTLLQ